MSTRFQTVGSLLRPADLLAYKSQIEHRDDIAYPFYADFPGYEQCEAAATKAVVAQEIEHGLSVLTDGEYSKSLWHLDFVWGLGGVQRYLADHGYWFRDLDEATPYETRRDIGIRITGPLSGRDHHFIQVWRRLQALAGGRATKLCVPSPSHIFGELSWSDQIGGADSVYADQDALRAGLEQAYRQFVQEYAAAGGTILQFDDCLWEMFADDNPNSPFSGGAIDSAGQELAAQFIQINNALIDYGHSLGLTMWTHNCRGNYDSRNMGAGSYAKIADLFFRQMKYDRFFLEWDDERAGSLQALAALGAKPDTQVVLGLLSSKTATLDDEDRVRTMLDQAAHIVPKDRLYLSHQCGFASCDGGNELTAEQQWAKIDQGQRLAQEFWGE
jgi:methionine synthase II (cobalamin-independent)